MKKFMGKILSILFIIFSMLIIGINSYAHPGRTDSSGGHRDNGNRSGLGYYHYHCGGHEPHLHPNGVCPYSTSSSSSSSSSSKKTTSTTKKQTPSTVAVTSIKINETKATIEVGNNITLTAAVSPSNATNKNVKWKSSDTNIATIDSSGKVTSKKPGTVSITATSSNGKSDTVKLIVEKKQLSDKNNKYNSQSIIKNNINNSAVSSESDSGSNFIGGLLALGLLGGGGYLGYKKYKKS